MCEMASFEKRARRIFGFKREELRGGRKEMRNKKLHNL
jgi:hypothetical protein